MTRIILVAIVGLAMLLPFAASGGPDANQTYLIQRAQDAKRKLAAAQAAAGAERQRLMREHMRAMDEILTQMQKAKPHDKLTAEQMHDWIDEHLKLMTAMLGQMMEEHHMIIMQDPLNPDASGKAGKGAQSPDRR